MMDENDRYQEYFDYFSDQLSMDLLKKDYPYDSEMLDNILELIVETVCTKRPLIRIGAEERPAEIVRSRFMKLNAEHIRYVMDCFKENTTKIRNIRQYMLNQASDDRSILAQRLNISPHQLSYVTNSGEGEGLLFYGNVILPFIDRFPTDLELYRIMTTKLNEVAQEKEA
mgnify:FL=1